MADLDAFVARVRDEVNARLSALLASPPGTPARIVEAVRFAALGGGKRFRPLLVIASGEAADPDAAGPGGRTRDRLLSAACAVEMIHTFSLIHDDLPALDDDDLRRGRPTLHVQFDEATAILAGDALLNRAYELLAAHSGPPETALSAIAVLARAVGLEGMIAGQVMDLDAEGAPPDPERLHLTHALKTGALITASCRIGGIVAGAPEETLDRLSEFGRHVGLAFQIVDDVLDVEGTAEALGKSPGKDARSEKATFPAIWGLADSRRRAAEQVDAACRAVEPLGPGGDRLTGLARRVLTRTR